MERAELVNQENCWRVGGHWCFQIPSTIQSVFGYWKSFGSWANEEVMQTLKLKTLVGAPLVLSSLAATSGGERKEFDVFDYIDPLIGTINGGRCQWLQFEDYILIIC